MNGQDATISKRTPVREALEAAGGGPCLAREDDDILVLAEALGERPGVHTIAVVDSQGRLTGIIPMRLLLDELFLSVAPEEFLIGMRDIEDVAEFGRITRARRARDLMQPPISLTMDDSVRDAFALMHEHRLEGLPIVDAQRRVVGYLDRFQLIRLWLRKRSPGEGR